MVTFTDVAVTWRVAILGDCANLDLPSANGCLGSSSTIQLISDIWSEKQAHHHGEAALAALDSFPPASRLPRYDEERVTGPGNYATSVVAISPETVPNEGSRQYSFPPQELANKLVDAYFERVHPLFPFLHEGTFRAGYEDLWKMKPDQLHAETSLLAIVNLVFAHGYEFNVDHEGGNFITQAAPALERSKKIILSQVFRHADLNLIQSLLLLCHYLQGTLELDECWKLAGLLIRNAICLGIHIDPACNGYTNALDTELRRRAWWGCVVLDRVLSMKLGRSPSINPADASAVNTPLDVDDQHIRDTDTIPRQPSGRPSRMSFWIQTCRLSHVINAILSKLYSTRSKGLEETAVQGKHKQAIIMSNIFLLAGQLQQWWDDLPVHLKQEPTSSEDIDFQRQRRIIRVRYLTITLLLQRPGFFLLVNQKFNNELMKAGAIASSNICISAAVETITIIRSHYDRRMLNSLSYNIHCVLTSLAVLAMVQQLERSTRSLLSSIDPTIVKWGLEFLRSSRNKSALADRYGALMETLAAPFTNLIDTDSLGQELVFNSNEEHAIQTGESQVQAQIFLDHGLLQSNPQMFANGSVNDWMGTEPWESLFEI
ncbi:hypothetical protein LTR93_011329 [Exophiala xenobiotica]|nr:hypothetical protein LTR93_011329 [Exophiala xenobiotica]